MNGKSRLEFVARRNGTWDVSEDSADKMMRTQDFISNELELFIQVTYSGYTVKRAKLWDFSDDAVVFQKLTSDDREKAGRIEDVLLGNSRRF